jgi:hypothetical protein
MQATALQRPSSGSLTHYSSLLFALYRSHLSGAVGLVVPEHTRDALFQLVCDLRANTPKDRRFLARHARALMPHTLPGWLALASTLGLSFSGLVGLACAAAALSVAGLWALMGLAVAAGVFLSGVMAVLSFSLLVAALVSGSMAAGALMMYASAMAVLACLRFTRQLLLGSPRAALPSTMHPAAVSSAEPAAPPQQDGLVLPYIRTKSPLKGSGNSSPPPAAVNSPPAARASPRRLLPAAVAAAALADSQAAAASAVGPATLAGSPAAVRGLRPSPFSSGDGDSKNASGKPVAQADSGATSPPGAPKTPLAEGLGVPAAAPVAATS